MSIQAVAWALEQDLPGTAKLVLISLCNHADHVDGHCWPSAETIAKEASIGLRSVYRWIGALQRNEYIDVRRSKGKDGKQRANNYWIRFDRNERAWEFYGAEADSEPDEPTATVAPGEEAPPPPENESKNPNLAVGPGAIGVTRQESLAQTVTVEPSARARGAPEGFDPKARQSEIEKLQAAEAARKKNQRVFVFKGTEAWAAWNRDKKYPETWQVIDGQPRCGWWFPTLFPPKSTGPPASPRVGDDHTE
jgi:hypothetical protein